LITIIIIIIIIMVGIRWAEQKKVSEAVARFGLSLV
jgi:hypothetical protein